MRNRDWGIAGALGAALIIGCGGGVGTPSTAGTSGVSTTAVGTTSVVGTTTTGGTATATALPAGTYHGTFSSTAFSSGGVSNQGPSGNADLVVGSNDGFVLALGTQTLEGNFVAGSPSFQGTFTSLLPSGGTAISPVAGTLIQTSRTILRFSVYRDDAHTSGIRYSASFAG